MSEIEFATLDQFDNLPLLDADDPQCATIESTNNDPAFAEVIPVVDLAAAHGLCNSRDLVAKGGVRHRGAVQPIVIAYFWRKKR